MAAPNLEAVTCHELLPHLRRISCFDNSSKESVTNPIWACHADQRGPNSIFGRSRISHDLTIAAKILCCTISRNSETPAHTSSNGQFPPDKECSVVNGGILPELILRLRWFDHDRIAVRGRWTVSRAEEVAGKDSGSIPVHQFPGECTVGLSYCPHLADPHPNENDIEKSILMMHSLWILIGNYSTLKVGRKVRSSLTELEIVFASSK